MDFTKNDGWNYSTARDSKLRRGADKFVQESAKDLSDKICQDENKNTRHEDGRLRIKEWSILRCMFSFGKEATVAMSVPSFFKNAERILSSVLPSAVVVLHLT